MIIFCSDIDKHIAIKKMYPSMVTDVINKEKDLLLAVQAIINDWEKPEDS